MPSAAPQLAQSEPVTLHYFGLKGAAGTTTIVLEQGGLEYSVKIYDFPAWGAFKPQTPTGLLPLMEYSDGTMIAESGALARAAAAQAGLLGEGREFARSEMLMGMIADTWKLVGGNAPTIMTVKEGGSWNDEKKKAWEEEFQPKIKASLERFGKVLLPEGDRFTTSGDLLGELELWYRLYQLILPYGGKDKLFGDVSVLKPFYDRVSELPGPKKFSAGETKWGQQPDYFCAVP